MTTYLNRSFRYPSSKVKFQSLKLGKSVFCQSKLEADYALLLEFDPMVLTYQNHGFCIYYKHLGKNKTFTPHFLIQRNKQQTAIWLVSSNHESNEEKHNLNLFSSLCSDHSIGLEAVHLEEVRRHPRLNNLKLLWRFSRVEIEPQHILRCRNFFEANPTAVFNDLLTCFKGQGISYNIAFALIFHRVIEFDFDSLSLNENTPIRLDANYQILKGEIKNERF